MRLFAVLSYSVICLGFFQNKHFGRRTSSHKTILEMSHPLNKYPLSQKYYENFVKRLNEQNNTFEELYRDDGPHVNPFMQNPYLQVINIQGRERQDEFKSKTSKNFQIITNAGITFSNVGGYDSIKQELFQCVDMLTNYTKYQKYNVRIPKGLIFEGPPGNGKTLLAKAFAGESGVGFIPVSGSEFQEKYVGVGASRIRELFQFAKDNIPCIIFIDEIDALGRTRSNDGESSSSERDSTLNELLVALDGFKNTSGVFLIGATNRADLLDPALIRPGRIDKRIYIGLPDEKTRKAIIQIHIQGKPYDSTIEIDNLVDITKGYSAAQIENILNEAMLNALKSNYEFMSMTDIDLVLQKMLAGWQPVDHQFTLELIHQIAVHEMGHALVGLYSEHHSRMSKIVINLSSPNNPAYTIFERSDNSIHTRESLFEHLAILLAGRLAEELCFGLSITTGAINDFEEALKLAEKMIIHYGMGKYKLIYPHSSDKYKEMIDNEVSELINDAILYATHILNNKKEIVLEGANLLMEHKVLHEKTLIDMIQSKYKDL
jgi:cell division protease FtsH